MKNTKYTIKYFLLYFTIFIVSAITTNAQNQSIARDWNEALLQVISRDYARPTIHARNLYHQAIVMHEAWAVYEPNQELFLLGKSLGNYQVAYTPIAIPLNQADRIEAQKKTLCFAAYRLMVHRFRMGFSPAWLAALVQANQIMLDNSYNYNNTSTDYINGGAAELGNYIGQQMIAAGLADGANENLSYTNQYYEPINAPLVMAEPGNPDLVAPNNWQQLQLESYIDQAGNPVLSIPKFLSPEWGNVVPFAMTNADKTVHTRNGDTYNVYHDPGAPPLLDTTQVTGLQDMYKWNFTLVNRWAAHLDPNDGVLWDISPASIGNVQNYPSNLQNYTTFYDVQNGGDAGIGHTINPKTGQPYTPQIVPRGDYTRVLAEFWADGPQSATPPGHWFGILNYVNDSPLLVKKWKGQGPILDNLEWDIKSYLTLGGAMHDAAVTAWGCKGWYDYIRPVSAIRYMADKGQSSNPNLPNFHPAGMPLIPGEIEIVQAGDPLAIGNSSNIGKIKIKSWKGHDLIVDPETDMAGVGWILAEDWWPYQRPSFVSPPFAGYVSGHSTFSRAAAEVLGAVTGDPFFPGGMGEFVAPKNEFLEFEEGPSVDITLQWATYRDAADQSGLSRIWGGIHPPVDDIMGRLMGEQVGLAAFAKADDFFNTDDAVLFSLQNVWLEGFYDNTTGLMRKKLATDNLVPQNQDYDNSPWYYNGSESLGSNYPTNFVDWVLVCLHDINGTVLDSKACCLNNNGSVAQTNSNASVSFDGFDSTQDYIVSIHHRNHLAVAANVTSGTVINFNNTNNILGVSPTKLVAGKQMLHAGDFDGNGIINNLDFNIWTQDNVVVNQYVPQDADGNSVVNNLDYNLWENNRSKVAETIVRY